MSQKYEIRRPHFEGKKEASCSVILPAKFVEHIGIQKGDYVRIYKEHNRILVERLSNQEPQIKVKACRVIYPPEIKENT